MQRSNDSDNAHRVVQLGGVQHHVRCLGLVGLALEHEQRLHLAPPFPEVRADGVAAGSGGTAVLGGCAAASGARPTGGKRVAIHAEVGEAETTAVGHVFGEEGGIA